MGRTLIVGTAGHIDHGKSALVRALTGTDPDRLREEQERGITIDLGFAHAELSAEATLSFIDVPGHERFVRNMLAGAHGIDAVLLVVAADESVMPQTREHFAICRLLGIPRGVVALTKCDLADDELQELAESDVRELVADSFLEGAQLVRVSARTGQGLDGLRAALGAVAASVPPRACEGLARLPVDRVFTMRGFGTVATGTLVSGRLTVGQALEVLPSGIVSRVRGLQIHGVAAEQALAGHRTAVNFVGLEATALARGDVLTAPGTMRPTSMLDVRLELLPGERPLRDQARVRVHLASAERLGRVRLVDRARLEPGAACVAQLRLEQPGLAGRGDRLIVRSYSPQRTIGGARVLDPLPPRRGRRDAAQLEAARGLAEATPLAAACAFISAAGERGIAGDALAARVTTPRAALDVALTACAEVTPVHGGWIATDALSQLRAATLRALGDYHRERPLENRMPMEEVRQQVFGASAAGAFEAVLENLAADASARRVADGLALAGHAVSMSSDEQRAREALGRVAREAGLTGLPGVEAGVAGLSPALTQRVSRVMLTSGELKRVGGALVDGQNLEAFKREIRERWPTGSRIDVAEVKDLTGLSRKYVIPLLEYLDSERVTRRSGATRTLIG